MSLNEKLKCPTCKNTKWEIYGILLWEYIPELLLSCISCKKPEHFSEMHYKFFLQEGSEFKCECRFSIFEVKGFYYDKNTNQQKIRLLCSSYECKKFHYINSTSIQIQPMGLRCSKCNQFGEDRDWNKNKRGYDINCYICGHKEFEPEY